MLSINKLFEAKLKEQTIELASRSKIIEDLKINLMVLIDKYNELKKNNDGKQGEKNTNPVDELKGDKKKNAQDYLGKIITSLKYRERSGYGSEPESEDYEFEIEEPSIIPKKVFRKE